MVHLICDNDEFSQAIIVLSSLTAACELTDDFRVSLMPVTCKIDWHESAALI